MRNESVTRIAINRIVLFAVLIALGSTFSISAKAILIVPTKVFPFKHMINGIIGMLMGSLNAGFIALVIGISGISIGNGTFFVTLGGILGTLIAGIVHYYSKKRDWVVLTGPIGTAIRALISVPLSSVFGHAHHANISGGITTQW